MEVATGVVRSRFLECLSVDWRSGFPDDGEGSACFGKVATGDLD